MNAVILNGGSANGRGATSRKIRDAAVGEFESLGWTVKVFDLDRMTVKPCLGCFACWVKHPGTCAIQDDEEQYIRALVASDAQVWITPITFGGYSAALKKALDRSIPILLPFFIKTQGEIHHPQRYDKRRKLLAIGTLPGPDAGAEQTFRALVQRNAINMDPIKTDVGVIPEQADEAEVAARVKDFIRTAGIA
ncbi:MAG TPA: flavodoxin family protein [Terriglobales bacterium]|nr:flavodoxin family protein [Terriglobales bacterium]